MIDEPVDFFLRRVVHERHANRAVFGVDPEGLDQAIGVEIADADAKLRLGEPARDLARALALDRERDRRRALGGARPADEPDLRMLREEVEEGLEQFGLMRAKQVAHCGSACRRAFPFMPWRSATASM